MRTADNGDRYIQLKWVVGILAGVLLSVIGGWAAQRHLVEGDLNARLQVVERTQARVLERLDSNGQKLSEIYAEQKASRDRGR